MHGYLTYRQFKFKYLFLLNFYLPLVSISLHSYIMSLPSTTIDGEKNGVKVKIVRKKKKLLSQNHGDEYLNQVDVNRGFLLSS